MNLNSLRSGYYHERLKADCELLLLAWHGKRELVLMPNTPQIAARRDAFWVLAQALSCCLPNPIRTRSGVAYPSGGCVELQTPPIEGTSSTVTTVEEAANITEEDWAKLKRNTESE
jgi:hypothetical protein